MTKVVYNACYGGFGLSDEAVVRYAELKGITLYPEPDRWGGLTFYTVPADQRTDDADWSDIALSRRDIPRHDPTLVQVVEELGAKASGFCAELAVEEIPNGTAYRIDEYDGLETVMTAGGYDWIMP